MVPYQYCGRNIFHIDDYYDFPPKAWLHIDRSACLSFKGTSGKLVEKATNQKESVMQSADLSNMRDDISNRIDAMLLAQCICVTLLECQRLLYRNRSVCLRVCLSFCLSFCYHFVLTLV